MIEPGLTPGADDVVCPYGCVGAPHIERHGETVTLLGSITGSDPNHHWLDCTCLTCGRSFTKEWRYQFVCYSVPQPGKLPKLLRGSPVCYEEFENDPRKGQCAHNRVSYEDGKWKCDDCGGVPGTPGWVPWTPTP